MGDEFSIEDALIILRRRLKSFLIPVILLIPLFTVLVMLLPAKYTAEGKILITSPQISSELADTKRSTTAQERIEYNRARITARPQLLEVADETKLFSNRKKLSPTKQVKRMKDRFDISPDRSTLLAQGGRQSDAVAYRLSYSDRDPVKAMMVANELINRFELLDKNASTNDAMNTTEFIEDGVAKFERDLKDKLDEIAAFKQANDGALPEQRELQNRQLEQFYERLAAIEGQISENEEDKRYIETQIASAASGGGAENSPEQVLIARRANLEELRSRYTDAHPEVQAVLAEIRALERQLAPGKALQKLQKELTAAEEALAEAERSEADPETISELERKRDAISDNFLRKATSGGGLSGSAQTYLLQSRLISLENRGRDLDQRRRTLQTRIDQLNENLAKTPGVESQITDLLNERKFLEGELQILRSRLVVAQQSEDLQVQNRGEKIEVLEAAALPEKPSSPNRPALIAVGMIFSVMVGALSALGFEFLNPTIRGRNHLTSISGEPPLAVIPFINSDGEKADPFGRNKRPGKERRRGGRDGIGGNDLGVAAAE